MKKLVVLLAIALVAGGAMAQPRSIMARHKNIAVLKPSAAINDLRPGMQSPNPVLSTKSLQEAGEVCQSYYDLQTNSSNMNRIYMFSDGTIGATAIMSHSQSTSFTDRGTGYNYFDGSSWATEPSQRIENVRTGWPSYAPLGPSGEIVVTHGSANLIVSTRATKGTGTWTQTNMPNPSGAAAMLWARVVTSGTDHNTVHIIAMTEPTANGGTAYNGLDGAILYNRSLDGGATWDGWKQLDGMGSDEYIGFAGDAYAWAEPHGNTLAFAVGDNFIDQFVMKSTDNGSTWTKTIVWQCPYDKWTTSNDTTPAFYCSDGCMAIALDNNDVAHLSFGLQRAKGDADGKKWYPYTDGLVYWNENMSQLPQDLNPDTLYAHGNLPAYVTDTVCFTGTPTLAYYYNSMTSDPTMVIDDNNNMFLIYTQVTSTADGDGYMLRNISERTATISGNNVIWSDSTNILTKDLEFFMTECMYPSASPTSNDKLYIVFQNDEYAGSYVKGASQTSYQGQTSMSENYFKVLTPSKNTIQTGVSNKNMKPALTVSRNYPNPFKGTTRIGINMEKAGNVSVEVTNMMGQVVWSADKGYKPAGTYQIAIDGNNLTTGVYFYTVRVNGQSVTNKMVVE